MKFNIFADMHNFKSLKNALKKHDNIICLGDVAATLDKKELFKDDNFAKFGLAWKAFARRDFSQTSQEAKDWFQRVNIEGWKKQLDTIRNSGKNIILVEGNADFFMVNTFPEARNYLEKTKKESKLEFIEKPELKLIENTQVVLLPYQNEAYDIKKIVEGIDLNKPLFVLGHCPVFKISEKKYYMHHYNAVDEIKKKYKNKFYYIHGHIHPNKTYNYSRDLEIEIIALKASESFHGINVSHDVLQLDTETGKFVIIDNRTDKQVSPVPLPEKYSLKERHWNEFEK